MSESNQNNGKSRFVRKAGRTLLVQQLNENNIKSSTSNGSN